MFSLGNRRPASPESPELLEAWKCLDARDVPGALRRLRAAGEDQPLGEVALVAGRAAAAAGFDDLAQAAAALAAAPERAQALYDFGFACVERGVSYLAVPALREALRHSPGSLAVLRELVSAYEDEGRHREARDEVVRHADALDDWPDRYLFVFNALMAGDLETAPRQHALLRDPEDPAGGRRGTGRTGMLARAADAERAGTLGSTHGCGTGRAAESGRARRTIVRRRSSPPSGARGCVGSAPAWCPPGACRVPDSPERGAG